MFLAHTLPRNEEKNIAPESDLVITLNHVSLPENVKEPTSVYAVHGETRFLLAKLHPEKRRFAVIRTSFCGAQEVRLLADNAPVNLLGTMTTMEEMDFDFDGEEDECTSNEQTVNESESELDSEMIAPQPPSGYVNPDEKLRQKALSAVNDASKRVKKIQKPKQKKQVSEPSPAPALEAPVAQNAVKENLVNSLETPVPAMIPNVSKQLGKLSSLSNKRRN